MKTVIGIPARMGSTRFPGKPLATIWGLPMIEHVYRRCAMASNVNQVFVAACDPEIEQAVIGFGGRVVMTDPQISRPGLRVAAAAQTLELDDDDIVVVVQGDEPLVRPEMIDLAVRPVAEDPDVFCSNLMAEATEEQWADPNEVKVVTDRHSNAIFMSRSPIPSSFHPEGTDIVRRMRQVCVMPFRMANLLRFQEMEPTPLERAESIEMLRAIENGLSVRMVHSAYPTKAVDTEADRMEVERLMKGDAILAAYHGR